MHNYIKLRLRVIDPAPRQTKLLAALHEYQRWGAMIGICDVEALNEQVALGRGGEIIKLAEVHNERKLASVADAIFAQREMGGKMVLLSGPSSSGKTTTSKRLAVHLQVLGLEPVLISLDDYFIDRDKTPRDEDGKYDFEALEAINIPLFNDQLSLLLKGESITPPRYNFIAGKSEWHTSPLQLNPRSVLIIEGIHALNPRLITLKESPLNYKIYVSCLTSIALDEHSRISTSDNRLLRRLTRDFVQRGKDGQATIAQWPSVRRGEEQHIFPYQEQADVIINSSLIYEISVIRPFAEKILREVPSDSAEAQEAERLIEFLANFNTIDSGEIPPTSLLREFIGGSSFSY